MEMPALLKLKHRDVGALLIFCLLGFLVGCIIPDPTWAIYSSVLIAYHCSLGWLVFMGDERARRTLPIPATVGIHVVFVILVVVLVASRHHIPRFGMLPIPLAAIGIWILSCAVGQEPSEVEPDVPSRLPAYNRPRQSKSAKSPTRRRPLIGALKPRESYKSVPDSAAGYSRPNASRDFPRTQSAENPVQPAPAVAAPQPAPANGNGHMHAAAAASPAQPIGLPQSQPIENSRPPQPAIIAPQIAAVYPAQNGASSNGSPSNANGSASNGRQPAVSGVVVGLAHPTEPQGPPSMLFRDNTIAESIRHRHSDDLTRLNPILGATAEDHEEWLKERGTQNPTHRKIGVTVREEYEQWLLARALARSEQAAAKEAAAREKESDAAAAS
jgi:hypothetical protein